MSSESDPLTSGTDDIQSFEWSFKPQLLKKTDF
jgi:hypothetical protein